jgi:hypothetical protein
VRPVVKHLAEAPEWKKYFSTDRDLALRLASVPVVVRQI